MLAVRRIASVRGQRQDDASVGPRDSSAQGMRAGPRGAPGTPPLTHAITQAKFSDHGQGAVTCAIQLKDGRVLSGSEVIVRVRHEARVEEGGKGVWS
jgi:hypothetical protein